MAEPTHHNEADAHLTFTMQVANNPRVEGVVSGTQAMVAAGAQPEFVAANILQAKSLKSSIILRAGDPPQYNKKRGPKSGVNLSKTSKQGFFKGALSQEERFARLQKDGTSLPHNPKDKAHLGLKPTDAEYQHTMQLDINMRDILREVGPEGDLKVLGYDEKSGQLRLAYKEGHGPQASAFNGQFVVNIQKGIDTPQFYSRSWDRPENDPNWNKEKNLINKPAELAAVPDELYEKIFNQTFVVSYTEDQNPNPQPSDIKPAKVMANRARSASEFLGAMDKSNPHYALIKDCDSIEKILETLKTNLPEEEANAVILSVYDATGNIVAGDWDGMALGHPPGLKSDYSKVYNVFAPGTEGINNKVNLLTQTNAYLNDLKAAALKKIEPQANAEVQAAQNVKNAKTETLKFFPIANFIKQLITMAGRFFSNKTIEPPVSTPQPKPEKLSAFEKKLLSIDSITDIASDFAIARAGCITPHEFLFQQVLNDAYRDEKNEHYGEQYDHGLLQGVMDKILPRADIPATEREAFVEKQLLDAGVKLHDPMFATFKQHLTAHWNHAMLSESTNYALPHLQHDMNVHDLYQHGFDMRNPYGSNLDGAWLLVAEDGGVLYGETQEQLIEVLLTGDFLEKNIIEVNHGAEMDKGWDRVIERQLELKQTPPVETKAVYDNYQKYKTNPTISAQFSSFKNYQEHLKASEVKVDKPVDDHAHHAAHADAPQQTTANPPQHTKPHHDIMAELDALDKFHESPDATAKISMNGEEEKDGEAPHGGTVH